MPSFPLLKFENYSGILAENDLNIPDKLKKIKEFLLHKKTSFSGYKAKLEVNVVSQISPYELLSNVSCIYSR